MLNQKQKLELLEILKGKDLKEIRPTNLALDARLASVVLENKLKTLKKVGSQTFLLSIYEDIVDLQLRLLYVTADIIRDEKEKRTEEEDCFLEMFEDVTFKVLEIESVLEKIHQTVR